MLSILWFHDVVRLIELLGHLGQVQEFETRLACGHWIWSSQSMPFTNLPPQRISGFSQVNCKPLWPSKLDLLLISQDMPYLLIN